MSEDAGGASAAAPPGARAEGAARRVGLFGGSFDPIHAGHLHAARSAQAAFGLERVLFVPARRSPFKGGPQAEPAPGADRLAMVELAIAGEPSWRASALELEREGPSYTLDSVRALRAELGREGPLELFLILGSDQLAGLPRWRGIEELLREARPIVVWREGEPEREIDALAGSLSEPALARLRAGLVREPPLVVSASELRAGGLWAQGATRLVPPAVLAYARERGLYGFRPRGSGSRGPGGTTG